MNPRGRSGDLASKGQPSISYENSHVACHIKGNEE